MVFCPQYANGLFYNCTSTETGVFGLGLLLICTGTGGSRAGLPEIYPHGSGHEVWRHPAAEGGETVLGEGGQARHD